SSGGWPDRTIRTIRCSGASGNRERAEMTASSSDDALSFTVSTVWREERVSCPHPDVLRAYQTASLPEGAMLFLRFHLEESQCPYCSAVLEDLRVADERSAQQ